MEIPAETPMDAAPAAGSTTSSPSHSGSKAVPDRAIRKSAIRCAHLFVSGVSNITKALERGTITADVAVAEVLWWARQAERVQLEKVLGEAIDNAGQRPVKSEATALPQQLSGTKRRRVDDPADTKVGEVSVPTTGIEGTRALPSPSLATEGAADLLKLMWQDRIITDMKVQIPARDKPTVELKKGSEISTSFVAVKYGREAILVPRNLASSLVDVLDNRVRGATLEKGDALGTSRMSLFMAADILKLGEFYMTKSKRSNFTVTDSGWTRGVNAARDMVDPVDTTKNYAACLYYLQDHSMSDLWSISSYEHEAIVDKMDGDVMRQLLGLPQSNVDRVGDADDSGA
jgi:hypothetical protein